MLYYLVNTPITQDDPYYEEKRNIYVKGPGGADWHLVIVGHRAALVEPDSPGPLPAKK